MQLDEALSKGCFASTLEAARQRPINADRAISKGLYVLNKASPSSDFVVEPLADKVRFLCHPVELF